MYLIFHNHFKKDMIIIHPGEYYSSQEDIIISTVLGSCISVVLHDPILGYSGMNHFMLPGNFHKNAFYQEETGRYGIQAMELLINDMLKKGSLKQNLQAKVFGGGHVINNAMPHNPSQLTGPIHHNSHNTPKLDNPITSIPASNIQFAYNFLEKENIPLISNDTGGNCGRKILLFSTSSQILLKRFYGTQVNQAVAEELEYLKQLRAAAEGNDITLF